MQHLISTSRIGLCDWMVHATWLHGLFRLRNSMIVYYIGFVLRSSSLFEFVFFYCRVVMVVRFVRVVGLQGCQGCESC